MAATEPLRTNSMTAYILVLLLRQQAETRRAQTNAHRVRPGLIPERPRCDAGRRRRPKPPPDHHQRTLLLRPLRLQSQRRIKRLAPAEGRNTYLENANFAAVQTRQAHSAHGSLCTCASLEKSNDQFCRKVARRPRTNRTDTDASRLLRRIAGALTAG